ncbi:NAD(P)H-dependent flavin oxidoreductase [Ectopseudomonas oleovorans]|uniref:NAD(P)H-dependent flavin oxidoreductase n=1 Tax=Ectopseudomonas oleovorans TaxID=301 RepID=UPI0019D0AF34|nr:nitronate monooxygenase [Pseudomonas oleovorans]MBN7116650.1 2-nitropropane dioxygenase [Pseudomonas oleovorans]MBN7133554.1 2-nitropropane dioxygenase [Pseudomonas oleovorans]MBN7141018.1 2-nitropropane dioxygenase [Pseudomonas oleovorans]
MPLQKLLGSELPLIQAPMAGSQDHRLAAAVCEAGGLGSIPCAMLTPAALRQELQAMRGLTERPFNLNFFSHVSPEPDAPREAGWREALAPYYDELGVDPASIASGPGRLPFNDEAAALVEEFRPAVVSFHFGLPDETLLQRVRRSGAKILSSATTLDEALWLQERGVDAVIAQGLEAGGHRGHFLDDDLSRQLGIFALLPQLVDALDVPVIAAGGISDARGVAAAMALGAAGVQVGSAYLLCPEATTSALHRAALRSPAARHTALTNLFSGRPARGIVNRLMRELGPLSKQAPAFPLATAAIAPLRAAAEAQRSGDFSPLWAGQNVASCRPMPAAELTRKLARGFA